jgi:hypothetical protein
VVEGMVGEGLGEGVVGKGLGEGEGVVKAWWKMPRRGQSRKQMDENQCVRTEQATSNKQSTSNDQTQTQQNQGLRSVHFTQFGERFRQPRDFTTSNQQATTYNPDTTEPRLSVSPLHPIWGAIPAAKGLHNKR